MILINIEINLKMKDLIFQQDKFKTIMNILKFVVEHNDKLTWRDIWDTAPYEEDIMEVLRKAFKQNDYDKDYCQLYTWILKEFTLTPKEKKQEK